MRGPSLQWEVPSLDKWPGCIKNVKQEAGWKREREIPKYPMISEYVKEGEMGEKAKVEGGGTGDITAARNRRLRGAL